MPAEKNQVPAGYRQAGIMTTGYDGGNFDIKSPVLEHEECGCLVLPAGVMAHEIFHAEARRGDP